MVARHEGASRRRAPLAGGCAAPPADDLPSCLRCAEEGAAGQAGIGAEGAAQTGRHRQDQRPRLCRTRDGQGAWPATVQLSHRLTGHKPLSSARDTHSVGRFRSLHRKSCSPQRFVHQLVALLFLYAKLTGRSLYHIALLPSTPDPAALNSASPFAATSTAPCRLSASCRKSARSSRRSPGRRSVTRSARRASGPSTSHRQEAL